LTVGWRVEVTRRAERDLQRLDQRVRDRVLDALDRLVGDPPAGDVVKLAGKEEWRLRVGEWRVRFGLDRDDRVVVVLRVLPRGRAYR
jgi:mRNA interferase RelE/StbE